MTNALIQTRKGRCILSEDHEQNDTEEQNSTSLKQAETSLTGLYLTHASGRLHARLTRRQAFDW